MEFWTKKQHAQLIANYRSQLTEKGEARIRTRDHCPVVKLFNPTGRGTWLLTELDADDEDQAFGLADLGMGMPKIGWIYIPELKEFRGRFGLGIERELHFATDKPLSWWAAHSRARGFIDA